MKKIFLIFVVLIGVVQSYCQHSKELRNNIVFFERHMSFSDRVKELQIPQEKLKNIPTCNLIDSCLSFPYLMNIFIYNDTKTGFREIVSNYNGFQELFNRKDLFSIILEKVKELPSKTETLSTANSVDRGYYSIQYMVLKHIIGQCVSEGKLNDTQKKEMIVYLRNNLEVMKFYPQMYSIGKALETINTTRSFTDEELDALLDIASLSWVTYNIDTPNGSNINASKLDTNTEVEFSQDEKDAIYNYLRANHSVTMANGGEASRMYNCHGYAWYMYDDHQSDPVVILSLSQNNNYPYLVDESYEAINNESDADIVVYGSNLHSARRLSNGSYISKWGLGPVFIHSLYDTDYGSSVTFYKRATPSVIGDTRPCSSTYRVYSLHNDANVSWSFSGGTSSSLIAQNSPSTNRCTISNSSHTYIKDNLVATVSRSGASTYTVSKALDTGINFSGSYTGVFTGMAPAGVTYPPISSTSISSGNTYPVTGGYTLTLTSSYFQNATVSYTGSAVNTWTNTGNGTITMKLNNVWTSSTVTITGYKGCDVYQIKFFVFANMTALGVPQLIVESDGQTCEVMMAFESEGKLVKASELNNSSELEWDLTIANVKTGKIVYDGHLVGPDVKLDTSDWEPGIYAFRAKIGDEVVTLKVTIGKNK